jgi:hypothetical protein
MLIVIPDDLVRAALAINSVMDSVTSKYDQ